MSCLTDYDNFDDEKLWFGKILNPFTQGDQKVILRKSQVLYDVKNLTRLRIKTPYFRIPFRVSEFKTNYGKKNTMTSELSPLQGTRKAFKLLIDKIDNLIKERYSELLDDSYTFKKSIKYDKEHYLDYRLNLHFTKPPHYIINHKKEPVDITYILGGMRGLAIIELSDIWINDNTEEYGCCWNIIELKVFPELIVEELLGIDDIEHGSVVEMETLEKKTDKYNVKCPNCTHKIEMTINVNIKTPFQQMSSIPYRPPPPSSYEYKNNDMSMDIPAPPPLETNEVIRPLFTINLDELLTARKGLKKTKTKESVNLMSGKVLDEPKPEDSDEE